MRGLWCRLPFPAMLDCISSLGSFFRDAVCLAFETMQPKLILNPLFHLLHLMRMGVSPTCVPVHRVCV